MASKDWVSAEKQDKNSDQIDKLKSQENIPKLRFPEFNGNWKLFKLKELAKIQRGASPRPINDKKWYDTNNKNVGWVRIGDVTDSNKFLFKTEDYFSEEGVKKSRFLPKGSLIMSICATIGKPIITNLDTCIHDGFVGFTKLKNIDKEFLYYVLFILEGKFCALGQTGSQSNLNSDLIRNMKIKIPNIDEQRKIVEFLSLVDKKIELMEKKYHILTNYKKGVMQKLFNENVCSEVKENNNYSTKWNIATLDEISKINTGTKDLKDKIDNGIYPFFVRSAKIESINSYSYDGEAILIPGDGKIGEVYHYINGKFDYHQRVYKISDFDKKIKGKYVYYYLQRNFFNHALKYTAKATVDSLRLPIIKEMIIKFPHIKEQSKIVHFLENIDNKIDFLEQQLEKIKEFKKYLLQQMFV